MATYTSNYGLHQWAPEDNFLRTDFNEDLKKIDDQLGAIQTQFQEVDEELAKRCQAVVGQFTGTGDGTVSVTLGFRPLAVFGYGHLYTGFCAENCKNCGMALTNNGFSMEYGDYNANKPGTLYTYIAFYT